MIDTLPYLLPVAPALVSSINRSTDAPTNNRTVGIIHPPDGVSVSDYYQELKEADNAYGDDLPYDITGQNSNSYIRGLVEATGGTVKTEAGEVVEWDEYLGGNDPIDLSEFRECHVSNY